MNTPPQSRTQFQKIILEKSRDINNYKFVFNSINNFLHNYNRGYLIIVGSPGSGKSAILASFVSSNQNPNINTIYYNAQVPGKNQAEEFLRYICTQIIEILSQNYNFTSSYPIPENATEGGWFFSSLLQKISDQLKPTEKLIIVIDGLDAINFDNQPPATNLFYLPRYIPDGIYFIFARRPFKKEQSGLLIEAPSELIDLSKHELENWDDENAFAQHWQKMQGEGLSDVDLQVLQVLVSTGEDGVSVREIAETTNIDALDIQEVLENWFEFLIQQQVGKENRYRLYHVNFQDWLKQQII